jgi:hypothetical protein
MARRLTSVEIWDALEKKGLATGVRPPDTSERKRRRQEESVMQRKVTRWFDLTSMPRWKIPSKLLFSVPNEGWRGPATAAIMTAAGLRSGVPDHILAVARYRKEVHTETPSGDGVGVLHIPAHWHHALFVEYKTPEGRVMPKQEAYHKILREQGYRVEVVRSFDQAVEIISGYLDSK